MKKDQWQDWIHRELTQEGIEPASEDFYRGIWSRIRTAATASSMLQGEGRSRISLGLACWRAVPVLSALVLLVALYGWFYPPDFSGQITTSVESYVLETDAAPSDADLLYQIMHIKQASELEAEP